MMNISNSQIKFYKKNGYLIVKNIINKKEVKILKTKLEALEKKNLSKKIRGTFEPGVKKSLIHNLHKIREFNKIIVNKTYTKICNQLLNSEVSITWNCKSNLKKKWHGSAEYYHQDYEYWKSYGFSNSNMLSCMIFVDDHSHENGGLWVFPKSHYKLHKHEKFLNINSLQKNLITTKVLDKLSKKNKPIKLDEKAGSCIFFHCKLVHGSAHNISSKDRRIILTQIADLKSYKKVNKHNVDTQNANKRKIYEKKILKKRLKKII